MQAAEGSQVAEHRREAEEERGSGKNARTEARGLFSNYPLGSGKFYKLEKVSSGQVSVSLFGNKRVALNSLSNYTVYRSKASLMRRRR